MEIMDKALDMGKSSATGSLSLMVGVVASTVIMAAGTIILAMVLSDAELGLYGVAMIPSSMINFFRDWGVNSAMTQRIASLRAAKRESEIHDVIVAGVLFEVGSGVVLSLVCFGLADFLAFVLQRPAASTFISIMSATILAGAVLAAANAIFFGYEKMMLNSLTSIFMAMIKTAVGPLLVILGFNVFGAILAASISAVAAGVLGIVVAYIMLFKPLHAQKEGKTDIKNALKPLLGYGIPLTISNVVIGVTPQIFAFVMALYAPDEIMGNYWSSNFFLVLLTFFSVPISNALFPTFSKLNPKEEPKLLQTVFASSIKYTSILIVPTTLLVISLATPMVQTLFADKYPHAPLFLSLSAIISLLAVVGNISLGIFQTAVKETRQVMKQSLLSLGVGLPIGLLLAVSTGMSGDPTLAVVGGIIGILIAHLPGTIWGLIWVWQHYHVRADFSSSAKILGASLLAAGLTFGFLTFFLPFMSGYIPFLLAVTSRPWMMLVLGFALFLIVYLTTSPLIGAINQAEINNFRHMFSGIPVVSKIVEIVLRLEERVLKLRRTSTTP